MARRLRVIRDDGVYHVLNRRVARLPLFEDDADFQAFERVLAEAHARTGGVRVLSYVLMGTHWHLLVQPRHGRDLTAFMQWLTVTHMKRWHAHRGSAGEGPVYQGRFKSFPVQDDSHLLVVARYIERNPVRAGLTKRAEHWRWASLWRRQQRIETPWLTSPRDWPVDPPRDYLAWVNRAETPEELAALQRSVRRGAPFGSPAWTTRVARAMKLESSLRDPWRPRRAKRSGVAGARK